jgi:hypothetical protein
LDIPQGSEVIPAVELALYERMRQLIAHPILVGIHEGEAPVEPAPGTVKSNAPAPHAHVFNEQLDAVGQAADPVRSVAPFLVVSVATRLRANVSRLTIVSLDRSNSMVWPGRTTCCPDLGSSRTVVVVKLERRVASSLIIFAGVVFGIGGRKKVPMFF